MNASRIVSRASASSAGSPSTGSTRSSGTGSDPLRLGKHRRGPGVGGRRTREVHRTGPAVATVEHVEAHVGGDAVEPRPQLRAALEAVVGAPGAHHGLLHRVLGLERRTEHPVAVGGELAAVPLQDVLDRAVAAVEPRFGDVGHVRRVVLGRGHAMRTASGPGTHRCPRIWCPGTTGAARCSPAARSTPPGRSSPPRRAAAPARRW